MITAKPISTFGPVLVLSKRESSASTTVAVRLCQQVSTIYPLGLRPYMALQEELASSQVLEPVLSCRKTTQRLLPETANQLSEGDAIGGHIVRELHAEPRYKGQKRDYDGGYAISRWEDHYSPDVDLR